ncbi:MAG: hypothetical protein ABSB19_16955 [Methylomonas sp.]|jgi:uncharacterized protein YjeT (DUF2065 family)
MKLIILATSLFIAVYGLMEFMKPGRFCNLAQRFDSVNGQYGAAAFRIVFGALMIYTGPGTAFPEFFRLFGIIVVLAGVFLLFMGYERFHKIVQWWCAQTSTFFRGFAILAILLGGFLAYAVMA